MDPTQSRRIARPFIPARVDPLLPAGCLCCSCDDTVDEFCRAHGGPTTRCCEDCRSVGVVHIDCGITPVSVQQKRAGIEDQIHSGARESQ